ncbi:MAG: YveK family protein, partial [bacterium]
MQPELRDYLRVLNKYRTLVLIALIGCIGGAGALTYLTTPVYEAEAKLFVGQRQISTTKVAEGQTVTQLSGELLKSYAAILETHPIAQQAIDRDRLGMQARDLADDLKADPILETQLISLRYSSIDPALAQRTVNAVARAFVDEVHKIESPAPGEEEPAVKVSIVAPALRPEDPVSPNPVLNYGLATVLGLLLGIGFAFLAEQLDTTVKDRDDVEQSLALPVLAAVPKIKTRADELYLEGDNQSMFAETFRKLRTAIQLYSAGESVRTILVTSPHARDGKTTTAVNLAAVYAYSGSRTVIIEADMRRPKLHQTFSNTELNGFALAMLRRISLDQAIVTTGIE